VHLPTQPFRQQNSKIMKKKTFAENPNIESSFNQPLYADRIEFELRLRDTAMKRDLSIKKGLIRVS